MATPGGPQGQEPGAGPHGREAMLGMDPRLCRPKGQPRSRRLERGEGHGLQPTLCHRGGWVGRFQEAPWQESGRHVGQDPRLSC